MRETMRSSQTKLIDRIKAIFPENIIPDRFKLLQVLSTLEELGLNPDILVALGHNWDRSPGKWPPKEGIAPELSIASKITALSALMLQKLGLVETVIFSGGQTARSAYQDPNLQKASPTEASEMKRYIQKFLEQTSLENTNSEFLLDKEWQLLEVIQRSEEEGVELEYAMEWLMAENNLEESNNILLEEKSVDTQSNAAAANKIINELGGQKIAVSSIDYHLFRVDPIMGNYLEKGIMASIPSLSFLYEISTLTAEFPELTEALGKDVIKAINLLLEEYKSFIKISRVFRRAHGPEYHLMALGLEKIFLILALGDHDKARRAMTSLAQKRRST